MEDQPKNSRCIDGWRFIGTTPLVRALVIGIDVSGSFQRNHESSIDFAANYIYARLNGLGSLKKPTALFVGSIGGERPHAVGDQLSRAVRRRAGAHPPIPERGPQFAGPGDDAGRIGAARVKSGSGDIRAEEVAEMAAFYTDRGWSAGMVAARETYEREGKPFEVRTLASVDRNPEGDGPTGEAGDAPETGQ